MVGVHHQVLSTFAPTEGEACWCVCVVTGGAARTLNLQVHLPHFREPVAEVHGKLLDHWREGKRRLRASGARLAAPATQDGTTRIFRATGAPHAGNAFQQSNTHFPNNPPGTTCCSMCRFQRFIREFSSFKMAPPVAASLRNKSSQKI